MTLIYVRCIKHWNSIQFELNIEVSLIHKRNDIIVIVLIKFETRKFECKIFISCTSQRSYKYLNHYRCTIYSLSSYLWIDITVPYTRLIQERAPINRRYFRQYRPLKASKRSLVSSSSSKGKPFGEIRVIFANRTKLCLNLREKKSGSCHDFFLNSFTQRQAVRRTQRRNPRHRPRPPSSRWSISASSPALVSS